MEEELGEEKYRVLRKERSVHTADLQFTMKKALLWRLFRTIIRK
jgi:hypothetical protein